MSGRYDRASLAEHPAYQGQRPPKALKGCLAEHTGHAWRFFGLKERGTGRACVCSMCWQMHARIAVTVATGCDCEVCQHGRRAIQVFMARHVDFGRDLVADWVPVSLKRRAEPSPLEQVAAQTANAGRSGRRRPQRRHAHTHRIHRRAS